MIKTAKKQDDGIFVTILIYAVIVLAIAGMFVNYLVDSLRIIYKRMYQK